MKKLSKTNPHAPHGQRTPSQKRVHCVRGKFGSKPQSNVMQRYRCTIHAVPMTVHGACSRPQLAYRKNLALLGVTKWVACFFFSLFCYFILCEGLRRGWHGGGTRRACETAIHHLMHMRPSRIPGKPHSTALFSVQMESPGKLCNVLQGAGARGS